jgi:hypothetical protein
VPCRLRFITFRHGVDGGRRGKEGGGKGGLLPTSNEDEEMSLGFVSAKYVKYAFIQLKICCRSTFLSQFYPLTKSHNTCFFSERGLFLSTILFRRSSEPAAAMPRQGGGSWPSSHPV